MKAVLVTNQSGIGRGYFEESMVHQVHDILQAELSRHGARLDAIYFCPHAPDSGCECRKPNPGMLLQAQKDLDIDLTESYVVGDKANRRRNSLCRRGQIRTRADRLRRNQREMFMARRSSATSGG